VWLAVALLAWAGGARAAGMANSAESYYRRAFHEPDPQKRIALLTRALAVNPNHLPSLRHRSLVYTSLDDKPRAFADLSRAAGLAPGDAAITHRAAALAEELKRHAEAAKLYALTLAVQQKNVGVRARRIDVLLKLLRVDEAVKEANLLVEQRPDLDLPYSVRADAYEWAGRHQDAIADLTRLIERRPRSAARYYLARCIHYRAVGDGRRALADAQKAIDERGSTAFCFAARGCSYEILGEHQKALADYQRAATLDTEKRYYAIWRCILLRKIGKRAQADRLIKTFLAKSVKDREGWITPVIRYLAGEMKEAEVFRLAKAPDPIKNREQLCEAYYYVGACHLAAGDLNKAEALFKKCLALRVHNFYEHGFSIRDLRAVKALREKKKAEAAGGPAEPQ